MAAHFEPVRPGGDAVGFAEAQREVGGILKPAPEGNLGDGQTGLRKHEARVDQPDAHEVRDGRKAGFLFKTADEVAFVLVHVLCKFVQRNVSGIVLVEVSDGPVHGRWRTTGAAVGQRISGQQDVTISLRVNRKLENVSIVVRQGEAEIARRKVKKALPAEMIRIPLKADRMQSKQEIEVVVE